MAGFAVVDGQAGSRRSVVHAVEEAIQGGLLGVHAVSGDEEDRVVGIVIALNGSGIGAAAAPGAQLAFDGVAAHAGHAAGAIGRIATGVTLSGGAGGVTLGRSASRITGRIASRVASGGVSTFAQTNHTGAEHQQQCYKNRKETLHNSSTSM